VSFVLNPAGGARFGNLTTKYEPDSDGAKYHLAVLLNEIVQTAPTINQPIHTHGQITGNFTTAEVNLIVNILNSGALEVPLKRTPVSESATALPMGAKKGFSDAAYKKAFQHRLQVFVNPGQSLTLDPSGYAPTTYVGMAGVGKDAATLEIDDPKAGIFGYDRQTRVTDIKDGMSNTMLVTEVYQDFGPWGRGGRATIRGLTAKPYINGPDGIGRGKGSGGVHVLMADGSVRFISENIKPEVFEALATMAGGEDVGEF
ncbi:MAG: hypothetical protein JWM11_3720, partial [Planctomycetaceae bacterium]|nr:hypothetical protein [Planctomycetaceae bacterium]